MRMDVRRTLPALEGPGGAYTEMGALALALQGYLNVHPSYGYGRPSPGKGRQFAVVMWQRAVRDDVKVRYRDDSCNAYIPSDRCAHEAHGTQIDQIWIPAMGVYADALVMWSPEWHLHPDTRAANRLTSIIETLEILVVEDCLEDIERDYPSGAAFKRCVADKLYRRVYMDIKPNVQVGVVGYEIYALSAARGGLIVRETPYGNVVMLPTLENTLGL